MNLEQGISDLYIVLTGEDGVINQTLSRNNMEYYDLGDSVTALECMADDVDRVWRLVEWHDELAGIDSETWKFLESDDPNDFELKFKESAWLLRLKERIDSELMMRELREKDDKDKQFLFEFCDFLLGSISSLDSLEKDDVNISELIEDFLEE